MAKPPKKAFVLAAGKGERMRPLTDNCPKPLLYVGDVTMLDRALDALAAEGVEDVVVNVHYLGDMIAKHLEQRTVPKITVVREDVLLDTGGGVRNVLDFFGDEPFYVLNADVVWTDGEGPSTLRRLADAWDGSKMDLLLLVNTAKNVPAYAGKGDYTLDGDFGQPVFAKGGSGANVIFAGPRIVHPRLFDNTQHGVFSFLQLFHKAEAAGKLYALLHNGDWYHVGTPEALEKTNQTLSAKKKKHAP